MGLNTKVTIAQSWEIALLWGYYFVGFADMINKSSPGFGLFPILQL